MAVPKRRMSKARSASRRSQWRTVTPTLVKCSHCGAMKRAHFVCPQCGHYAGRSAIAVAEES